MNAKAILDEIRPLGRDSYKKVLLNHGAQEPCWGVKIEDLKKIQKRVGTDYRLALDLYDSGVYDAMYLAGLVADDVRMTKEDLRRWARTASAPLAGSTVAWVASGSPHAREIALEWIDTENDLVAVAGWSTLACCVATRPDADLDLAELKRLLKRVRDTIHTAPDRVRYHMNGFVIAVGCYVKALTSLAKETGERIGRVQVDMGNTACQVPFAPDYIRKVELRGTIGRKRQTAKC